MSDKNINKGEKEKTVNEQPTESDVLQVDPIPSESQKSTKPTEKSKDLNSRNDKIKVEEKKSILPNILYYTPFVLFVLLVAFGGYFAYAKLTNEEVRAPRLPNLTEKQADTQKNDTKQVESKQDTAKNTPVVTEVATTPTESNSSSESATPSSSPQDSTANGAMTETEEQTDAQPATEGQEEHTKSAEENPSSSPEPSVNEDNSQPVDEKDLI